MPSKTSAPPVVYVAPGGDDAAPGTRNQPMATLPAALKLLRKSRTEGPRKLVLFGGRHYGVDIELGPKDSGLTIEAAPGEVPVLYGGRPLLDWEPDSEHFVAAELPEVAAGAWDFRSIVVHDGWRDRAHWPAKGGLTHETVWDVPWMSTTGGGWKRKPTEKELTSMVYREGDIGPWFETENAELTIYHEWDESMVGVAGVDPETRTLTFSNPAGHPPGAFAQRNPRAGSFRIHNIRKGMTRPGQWYLDRMEGKLVYWPLPEEDPENLEVVAPTTFSVIRIIGAKGKPVRDVTIRGIVVSATSTPLIAGGFGARNYDGAIDADGAEGLTLTGVVVRNVGGTGIKVVDSPSTTVDRCRVHDTGAGGIYVEKSPKSLVANNTVHHVGRTYHSGIGIRASCPGGQVSHNHVHHTPYSAVNAGAENLHIEHNHLHHCMLELSDGGAIYFGFHKGVVVRGNYIHDIVDHPGRMRGRCHGVYLDEQAEDCLVEKNLIVDVPCALHGHMGRNNTWRNNVCISRTDLLLGFARCEGMVFDRNIFLTWGDIVIRPPEAIGEMPDNCFFTADGKIKGVSLDDYTPAGDKELELTDGSIAEDPKLQLEGRQVSLPEGSPAAALGIEPVDVTQAGPLG